MPIDKVLESVALKITSGPWQSGDGLSVDGQYLILGNLDDEGGSAHTVVCDVNEDPDEWYDNARLIAATPEMLRALEAQQAAEDAHCNCPECDEGDREWWTCGPCSERYGAAIELRHAALLKAGAMRVVKVEPALQPKPDGE